MPCSRRRFVAAAAATATIGVAGCLGGEETVDLDGEDELPVPVAGDPDAGVAVTVFEDFSCGGCAQFKASIYPELRETYVDPGEIRYEHRDFPVTIGDEWSWRVAGAARSVQDQADDGAFFAFTEGIYAYHGEYSFDVIESVAADAGVDGERAATDAEDERFLTELEAEAERAEAAGVDSTPTVLVEGQDVEPSLSAIDDAIQDAR